MLASACVAASPGPAAAAPPVFGHALKDRFAMDPALTNLNQGSYGVVANAVADFQQALLKRVERNPEKWFRVGFDGPVPAPGPGVPAGCTAEFQCALTAARKELGAFLGAHADDLVFVDNASEGVNVALRSLARFMPGGSAAPRPGTHGPAAHSRNGILHLDLAYGMVKDCVHFLSGNGIGGRANASHTTPAVPLVVEVDTAAAYPSYDADAIVALVEAAILANARDAAAGSGSAVPRIGIASFSHIVSVPGIVLPIARLAALCRAHGILTLVDGAHAPGQIALDVEALGADVYVGNGHKWLFTARGCAFVWIAPHVQQLVYPQVIEAFPGYPTEGGGGGGNSSGPVVPVTTPYPGALHSMFDWQGTKDYSGFLSLSAALEFRRSIGGEAAIIAYTHGLAVRGGQMLARAWGTQTMPAAVTGQLINVELPCNPGCPVDGLADRLYRKGGFWVPVVMLPEGAATRSAWLRISVGVYSEMADLELVRDTVLEVLGQKAQEYML